MSNYKVHLLDIENQLQNYIWLLEHTTSRDVIVVDPTEAEPVEQYCREHGLNLSQIWLTHWHKDHIGGVPELLQSRNIPVYGPREELSKIPFITHPLQHEAHFKFHDLQVDVLAVPGHTLGHIVYSQTTLLFIQDSKKTRNNSSTESINHSLRLRLTHAHICSIGFKSGLYAGSQRILCPCCSNNS